MSRIYRKVKDLITLNYWKRIKDFNVPDWVYKGINKWTYNHSPYDKKIYFRGNTFIYRVDFITIAQGVWGTKVYKKRKTV